MNRSETSPPDSVLGFTATIHQRVFIRVAYTVVYMATTEKNPTDMNISCRMSVNDIKRLDELAETDEYMNRSDVVRTAVRTWLNERQ
jgi:hypothetical protein